ncbi:MAG: CPBP family glutamic-type intramembrane protease [Desulfobacteraceae bacterium]|nr:CPBP family glutamic-type intramembrane protease [Desulfobacteraceae bacterium]
MNSAPEKNHASPSAVASATENAGNNPEATVAKNSGLPSNHLPERYIIKKDGDERVLTCLEAPNLSVHIEAGLAFAGSVARKSPGGTIFLDGVAQCEPFMDHERQVYNLDHHEGCVRAFTLAACEQAMVMYMKGLDLQRREWNIFANEPDIDTLLAIWILLNHARIGRQDSTQRRLLLALVRYEGVIDAMGLEHKDLCALPPELMRKMQRVIDHLRTDELVLKKEGKWAKADYMTYTAGMLHKIDQIFYKPSDFVDYLGIEELARIDLTDQRIAAVVEAEMGIYEIETHLNKLYGNRLGVVFLKKGANNYTVRQMDLFMPITLDTIYDRLNFVDAAVRYRTLTNKWGGAADIGGSPRDTGTRLTPWEIVQACREGVCKPDLAQNAYRFALTVALVGLIVLCAHIVRLIWDPAQWLGLKHLNPLWADPFTGFILTLLVATGTSLVFIARRRAWQYGWSAPVGRQWWLVLPAALVGALAGGLWSPDEWLQSKSWVDVALIGVLGMPLAAELLFRSLAHGLMAQSAAIQRCDTRWFFSWPMVGTTLLYLVFFSTLYWSNPIHATLSSLSGILLSLCGATLLSLAVGLVRERAQSLWPAVLFHMLAAAAAFGGRALM